MGYISLALLTLYALAIIWRERELELRERKESAILIRLGLSAIGGFSRIELGM